MSGRSGGQPNLSDKELTDLVLSLRKLADTLVGLAANKFREGSIPLLLKHGFTPDQADKISDDTWRRVLDLERKRSQAAGDP